MDRLLIYYYQFFQNMISGISVKNLCQARLGTNLIQNISGN